MKIEAGDSVQIASHVEGSFQSAHNFPTATALGLGTKRRCERTSVEGGEHGREGGTEHAVCACLIEDVFVRAARSLSGARDRQSNSRRARKHWEQKPKLRP